MKRQEAIEALITLGYNPFALTISFKQSFKQQELYPDALLYSCSNNSSSNFNECDTRARMIEKSFRKTLNLFAEELLGTSNIGRPAYRQRSPIVFYYMELMDWSERQNALRNIPGTVNICPLHYHGFVLVHPTTLDKVVQLAGDETLRRLSPAIQHSRLEQCSSFEGWDGYIRKDLDGFYAAYGGIYPNQFREDPVQYILNVGNQFASALSPTRSLQHMATVSPPLKSL